MDNHTISRLEFDSILEKTKTYTFSPLGKIALDALTFHTVKQEVERMLDEVTVMHYLYKTIAFPNLSVHELKEELNHCKAEGSCLYAEELYRIGVTLSSIQAFRSFLKSQLRMIEGLSLVHDDVFQTTLNQLFPMQQVIQAIEKAIGDDGEIRDDASKALKAIRKDIRIQQQRTERKVHDFVHNPNNKRFIQDSFVTKRQDRYVVPLIADHKGRLKGLILDSSASGETVFFEPDHIVEDNNTLIQLAQEEQKEIRRILLHLTEQVTQQWDEIQTNLQIFGEWDAVYAKAVYASSTESHRPQLNTEGIFEIYEARHPLIENTVVPVDLILGKDYQILVITGPNTGGKTVSLKTLGLFCLMTLAGMYIPARADSKVSIVDNVYIDIGDEQSIQQNLSTFSAHIKRISDILEHADKHSLILIDEIGAGTDPREGGALGVAILDYILSKGSRAVVTTHFEPIKNLCLTDERVENASCDFDLQSLSPTYQLLYGITGESKAITIAKRLGLTKAVVNTSIRILKGSQDQKAVSIQQLNAQKEKYIRLHKRTKERDHFLSQKDAVLKEKEAALEERERKLKQSQLRSAQDIIKQTKRDMHAIITQAKQLVKQIPDSVNKSEAQSIIKNELHEVMKKVDVYAEPIEEEQKDIEEALISTHQPLHQEPLPIKPGSTVTIKGLQQEGTVLEVVERKNEAQVQIGAIKFVLPLADLAVVADATKKADEDIPGSSSHVNDGYSHYAPPEAPYELNILGMRVLEAEQECQRYIENLHASGKSHGRIVHGKGTGALRTMVTDLLTHHSHVKKSGYAKLESGGYGVTEFWLKEQ